MGRAPCCEKIGIKRGRWTTEEDRILSNYIQSNGEGSWRSLPKNAGLKRCGKSCRLRWINYLRSDLKRGNITPEEEEIVVKLHSTLGNRWSLIASHLPGRTDNEIKNYWNSHLSRKLHNFIRKPSISHNVAATTAIITNAPLASPQPHAKRRPGRTSRSAMKPKTQNSKVRKTKKKQANAKKAVKTGEAGAVEEELINMELNGGAETELGETCDHYGDYYYCTNNNNNNLMSITDELSFDDVIIDLLLDETDPGRVFGNDEVELSNKGDSDGSKGFFESPTQDNQVNDAFTDEFIDWDCVWQEGGDNNNNNNNNNNNSSTNLCDDKEGLDSTVSWLLDGEDEAPIGKIDCENLAEPLDLDEENALVAWLLS